MDKEKAIQIIKEVLPNLYRSFGEAIVTLIPELKESKESEDEKIRKWLIALIKSNEYGSISNVGEMPCPKLNVLAWLEKQSEKPVVKIKPKFKVGDWVVYEENTYKIHNISLKKYYECLRTDGTVHTFDFEHIDSKSHLWTIQDAKDGDVLVKDIYPDGMSICLFKEFNPQLFTMKLYCSVDREGQFLYNHCAYYHRYDVTLCPATKEQRDTLEKAMADAGYTFDFDKKELKKIENKNPLLSDFFKAEYDKGFECGKQRVLKYPEDFDLCKKSDWSEEDEKILKTIIVNIENLQFSEEMREKYLHIRNTSKNYYQIMVEWLKSLKDRYTWKPSEEQLTQLKIAVSKGTAGYFNNNVLRELYVQLKQL